MNETTTLTAVAAVEQAHTFAAPLEWSTPAGRFTAVAFTGPGYHKVYVMKAHGRGWRPVTLVKLDPAGNTVVAFDEWRVRETGYVVDKMNAYPAWVAKHGRAA